HHVAQRSGLLVVAAPPFDADGLGDGHLHVIHVPPVPDRFEDAVAEAEHHDVLHRLLAQIMVDAEDLPLTEDESQRLVELPRRFEVTTERLLDHEPHPAPGRTATRYSRLADPAHNIDVGRWRRGLVEQPVTRRAGRT